MTMRVAVIGAGWGGMAAAVRAAQAGHAVTVLEASRSLGGRARTVPATLADGRSVQLDNGQHILIGAYTECLDLLQTIGVSAQQALLRLPLTLRFADGSGLALPDAAPPWDALLGIACARGWSARERLALLGRAARWRLAGFRCAPQASVAELCAGLPARLMHEFIEPLCVSALNTPAGQACGQTFLRVLHDSLFAGRGGSNLLVPRTDLGALLPEPAADWLRARGHSVHLGRRVQTLARAPGGAGWLIDGAGTGVGAGQAGDGTAKDGGSGAAHFDAVLLATSSQEAARLAASAQVPATERQPLQTWAQTAQALRFGAIATVYAELHNPPQSPPQSPAQERTALLPAPMLALRSGPAQFAFDRGQLDGTHGLLAFVVSAFAGERAALEQQVLAQASRELALPPLRVLQTVVERRATFLCTPQLARPPQAIAPGLLACGDYVAGPYPATLEGAVLHGAAAVAALGQ